MISTIKQLESKSRFFQLWSGKKMTIKDWFGEDENLTVQNTNSKLQKYKTLDLNYTLTINEIKQLNQFEHRTLIELMKTGITFTYQKFTIEFTGKVTKNDLRLDLVFTHKLHGEITPIKVTHRQALKELSNSNINNDMLDIIQVLYQVLKD